MLIATSFSVLVTLVYFVTCEEKCGAPHEVNRAKVPGSSDATYVLDSRVSYKCDPGFITGGTDKTSRCVLDPTTNEAVWTKPEIVCSPRSCADPGDVQNAQRSGSLFTFPNHVEYICNEGYRLSGQRRRYCEASGVWSGRLPSCNVILCGRPRDPANGRAVYTSLEYDSELTYECNKGLQLSSKEPRICGAGGEWTGAEPICTEIQCELPVKPAFGTMDLVGNKATVESIVFFRCNPGRKLVGSSSSKCLKTGEWTFPTPKCIVPCKVPLVRNGELGSYVEEYQRYRWRTVFRRVSEGTTLDEGANVVLKCDNNYLPRADLPLREITVTCREGQLSPEPECMSTSCAGDPPPIENGRAVVRARQHGATIYYRCNDGFERGRIGSVSCVYGSWNGTTPTCIDTRCHIQSLNYPGFIRREGFVANKKSIVPTCLPGYEVTENRDTKIYCNKGEWTGNLPPCTPARCKTESLLSFSGLVLMGQSSLDEGEWIEPVCSEGFEFSNKNDSKIYCREGTWAGNVPPCSPAHCLNHPPLPENGRIKSIRATGHGGVVEYECFQNYVMDGASAVTCAYGKWTGSPPACKDQRCYLKNLPARDGIDLTDDRPVNSNKKADVKCIRGYNLRYPEVYCVRGEWETQNKLSPCQEKGCQVKFILNGEMLEQKTKPIKDWLNRETGKETFYETADIGTSHTSKATLYVKCKDGYEFQGEENEERVEVTCRRGEWVPFPECQLSGRQPGGEETVTVPPTIHSNLDVTTEKHGFPDASEGPQFGKEPALSDNSTTENGDLDIAVTTINPPCSCKYALSDTNVLAYHGKRLLKFNDEVYPGSELTFYCKEPGYQRFQGPRSVTCPEDCSWHSTWYPSCFNPGRRDVTIRILTTDLERKNISVDFRGVTTVIPGTALQINCLVPAEYGDTFDWQTPAHSNGVKQRAFNSNTQRYRLIYYLSEASHLDSGRYLCYNNPSGLGREITISVNDVQCPEIIEMDGGAVSYSQNRSFGSRATFHCFTPYTRNGPSYVTCEASGLWSGPPTSCIIPTCSVGSLHDVIPEGVVPYIDESVTEIVQYDYILKLTCDEDGKALKGDSTATCSTDGQWKVGVDVHCAQGCGSLVKKSGSELIIFPEKEFYNMGESITFSCPDGKELTEDVERILCFKDGWTPPGDIPDCR